MVYCARRNSSRMHFSVINWRASGQARWRAGWRAAVPEIDACADQDVSRGRQAARQYCVSSGIFRRQVASF